MKSLNLIVKLNSRFAEVMLDGRCDSMKWVTREHAKVDRIACPWLIRNFVDKDAEFLFVPAYKVIHVAKEQNATPFDVPNAELGHHGEECSFDAIIKKYNLYKREPALLEL